MSQPETQPRHAGLARRLADTRAFSETLCEPLTAEDIEQYARSVTPPGAEGAADEEDGDAAREDLDPDDEETGADEADDEVDQ